MFEFFKFIENLINDIVFLFTSLADLIVDFAYQIAGGAAFIVSAIECLPAFSRGALIAIMGISMISMCITFFVDNA